MVAEKSSVCIPEGVRSRGWGRGSKIKLVKKKLPCGRHGRREEQRLDTGGG